MKTRNHEMSIHLRVHSSQERRPTFRHRSCSLIRSTEPPQSPSTHVHSCEAIDSDGHPCRIALLSEEHDWCNRHTRDLKDLNVAWEKIQKEAEKIEVWDANSAKQKMLKLQLAVSLRRRLRERFHTRGMDTADYTGWIAKVEQDTKSLADAILSMSFTNSPWYRGYLTVGAVSQMKDSRSTTETPRLGTPYPDEEQLQKIVVLQSPLSPRIPTSSLQDMPGDGSILVLKRFQTDLCEEGIRRLYSVVPDLDDSYRRSDSPMQDEMDQGAGIVRSWFRIMILNDSDAEILAHASRSRSIDDFLRGCKASQLEMYSDYFQNAWRPRAVQYLRVAVCAQTLAGGDSRMIRLLGGIIPSSTEGLRMKKPAWDIL